MSSKTLFEGKELIVYEDLGEPITGDDSVLTGISYAKFVGAREYNFIAITLESLKFDPALFNYGSMIFTASQFSKTFIIPKGGVHLESNITLGECNLVLKINDTSQEITISFVYRYSNVNPLCLTKISIF